MFAGHDAQIEIAAIVHHVRFGAALSVLDLDGAEAVKFGHCWNMGTVMGTVCVVMRGDAG